MDDVGGLRCCKRNAMLSLQEAITYMNENYDIPDLDVAISMGCNVGCPLIGRQFDDNWCLGRV